MKNSFKTGILISGIALLALACDPPPAGENKSGTIDTPQKHVDTARKPTIDTLKKDTVKK